MTLQELGYNDQLEKARIEKGLDSFQVARVILEHKDRYVVKNDTGEFDAELVGNLRFTAESRNDFPAVGDWVAISEYDEGKALIHAIFPRQTLIERRAAGKVAQKQIIAANVDIGLIMQSVDRDFNLNRIERYLTICNASRVKPVIILSKTDLVDEQEVKELLTRIHQRVGEVPVVPVTNQSDSGYAQLKSIIEPGKTYCLLGSSGVGKSTLLNGLSGKEVMQTGEISASVQRGKHVTSHRELILLPNGGILIDNPGMREVGISDSQQGLESTFDEIVELAHGCRYSNCTHLHEEGCAVRAAIEAGTISEEAYLNYCKMMKERAHLETSLEDKRKRDKSFGKLMKHVVKHRKENKY